jgi:hypothetical protein
MKKVRWLLPALHRKVGQEEELEDKEADLRIASGLCEEIKAGRKPAAAQQE